MKKHSRMSRGLQAICEQETQALTMHADVHDELSPQKRNAEHAARKRLCLCVTSQPMEQQQQRWTI
jgi:hypothetical protein